MFPWQSELMVHPALCDQQCSSVFSLLPCVLNGEANTGGFVMWFQCVTSVFCQELLTADWSVWSLTVFRGVFVCVQWIWVHASMCTPINMCICSFFPCRNLLYPQLIGRMPFHSLTLCSQCSGDVSYLLLDGGLSGIDGAVEQHVASSTHRLLPSHPHGGGLLIINVHAPHGSQGH